MKNKILCKFKFGIKLGTGFLNIMRETQIKDPKCPNNYHKDKSKQTPGYF